MRNPYKKIQNSSIHGSKVMLASKSVTNGRKDGRRNNPEAICPSYFFAVGGIKIGRVGRDFTLFVENYTKIIIYIWTLHILHINFTI